VAQVQVLLLEVQEVVLMVHGLVAVVVEQVLV
jgi:hypothetical protein